MLLRKVFIGINALVATVCLLSACSDYSQISITNVNNVKILPAGGGKFQITLDATINNPTRRHIKLKSATLNLQQKKMAFATLTLTKPVDIVRRSEYEYPVSMEVQLQNVLLALMGLSNLSIDDFTVDGKIVATAFPMRKTLHIEQQSLTAFEAQFGDIFSSFLKK
jgi:hypothetical protein